MDKSAFARVILLPALLVLIFVNATSIKSPLIGVPISLAAVAISSDAVSKMFFPRERQFIKQILGLAVFVSIIALFETFLILTASFTETLSVVGFLSLSFALCILSLFIKPLNVEGLSRQSKNRSGEKKSYLSVFLFLFSVTIAFYGLLTARTGEGNVSVWLTIPVFFLPTFFLASFSLALILFFTDMNLQVKLALVSVYSFLAHSLFLIVWYPGRYGDPWGHLAEVRYLDNTGMFFGYSWVFSQRLFADIVKYKAQYGLVGFFGRAFSLDVYWVQIFLIPVVWSLFVPIFFYKLAELLAVKKVRIFPLLAAISSILFSSLIYWGAISVPNSLGFIFLLFSITLLLYWSNTKEKRILLLSILASVVAFFSHPQTGIFALVFLFEALIIQSRFRGLLKAALLAPAFAFYPFFSYVQEQASFSLEGLFNLENFLTFQFEIATLLLIFGFLGFMYSLKGGFVKGKNALMLFMFFLTSIFGYYVTRFGMNNALLPDRIPPMMDLLLVPFVALGLKVTANFLKAGFSRIRANSPTKVATPRLVGLIMVCIFVSFQATSTVWNSYPLEEISPVQPSWYEMDAIYHIASTPQKYVVLCEPGFASLAAGLLGQDFAYGNNRGVFGVGDWDWWINQLWWKMVNNPSGDILTEAMQKTQAEVAFVVVSVRMHGGLVFEDVVKRVSEIMQIEAVFGDGKLYIFEFSSQPTSGQGPSVKVIYDYGASEGNATTEFSYSFVTDVKYTLTLSGHSSYNITAYPNYWTFSDLYVNQQASSFDNSSDINQFIYVHGVGPQDVTEVVWQANDLYQKVGWKEDSFKNGWQTSPYSPGTVRPNISTDGNILQISWTFAGKYYYYHYAKQVHVSTDDFSTIMIKWKSTGPIAEALIYYEDDPQQYSIIGYGSESDSWKVTMVDLPPGKQIAYVAIGITSYKDISVSGPQSLYVDYILIGRLNKE